MGSGVLHVVGEGLGNGVHRAEPCPGPQEEGGDP